MGDTWFEYHFYIQDQNEEEENELAVEPGEAAPTQEKWPYPTF